MHIFYKSPALRKLEETKAISKELGQMDMNILGAAVKQCVKIACYKNIEFKLIAIEMLSDIIKGIFTCNKHGCIIALHSTANSNINRLNTLSEYAFEYITYLNIQNMNQRIMTCVK